MTVREIDAPPSLTRLYAKAAATGLRGGDGGLPDDEILLPELAIDPDHVAAYDRVCGFTVRDRVPATYLFVAVFPMAMQLVARRDFPLPLAGLVHIRNRIVQHRPLTTGDRPALRVRVDNLRPHPKGRQFDIVAAATIDGETVWTNVSTSLARGGGDPDARSQETLEDVAPAPDAAEWRVPADMGRRYARVSGDRNPIHLYPLTARLFGFPRPIVHGMWTKARCLAALEGRLPDQFEVEVRFDRPLLLPGRVRLSTEADDGGWRFAVYSSDDRHLLGAVRPVA